MAPRVPDNRPDPPKTAVVQIADDGTATLYLGTEIVEHAAGVDASAVMRILVDYAASIDTGVRVTTQMPDGTWTRHRVDPDGRLSAIPRNEPATRTAANPVESAEAPRSRRLTMWSRIGRRIASRTWLLAMLVVVAAVLVAVLTTN